MDYTQLQDTIQHHTTSDIAFTIAVVLALAWTLCTVAEWFSTGKPLVDVLIRQWRWIRSVRIW